MPTIPDHPKVKVGADGSLMLNFEAYGEEVEVAAISGDGRRILTVKQVGEAQVWDADSGAQVGAVHPDSPLTGTSAAPTTEPFAVFIESAALDHHGSLALLGLNDGTAGIFRIADDARLAVLYPPGEQPAARWSVIRGVSFSAEGRLVLVGFEARRVGVWSADGQRLVAVLSAPSGSRFISVPTVRDTLATTVATSPDGRWVFAGCADTTAVIWELASQRLVFEALEHAEDTLAVFDDKSGFGCSLLRLEAASSAPAPLNPATTYDGSYDRGARQQA